MSLQENSVIFFSLLETGSHQVPEAGFELTLLLPQPPTWLELQMCTCSEPSFLGEEWPPISRLTHKMHPSPLNGGKSLLGFNHLQQVGAELFPLQKYYWSSNPTR